MGAKAALLEQRRAFEQKLIAGLSVYRAAADLGVPFTTAYHWKSLFVSALEARGSSLEIEQLRRRAGWARIGADRLEEIRARVSLEQLVARRVKLRRTGRAFGGLCPFHNEKTPSFTVSNEKGYYHCFGCGAHGDAIEFVMQTEGVDFREAVRRLDSGGLLAVEARVAAPPVERPGPPRRDAPELVTSATVGRWLWQTSVPARGEIIEAWLRARALDPQALPEGLDGLRFHPRAVHAPWAAHDAAGSGRLTLPAMIAPMRDADGHVRGVHATYLAADGRAKASLPAYPDGTPRPTRKMWGPVSGHAVWLAGLPHAARDRPLLVGEGIETVWSVAQGYFRRGVPVRAAATLSLDNLQGGIGRDAMGAIKLWSPMADLQRPPFVLPEPGAVIILVDADMKPIERLVQAVRGAVRGKRMLGALERAALCGSIACQHWRHAGATSVKAIRPPVTMDFNDTLARIEATDQ
jgi:DNA primase